MQRSLYLISAVLLLFGCCTAQSNNALDVASIEKQVKEQFPDFQDFNASSVPSEEHLNSLLKQKCEKNGGGEEAYNALANHKAQLQSCIQDQLNATELQAEIEESKKTGSMDEVFGKYCKKFPEIYKCVEGVTEKAKLCLSTPEQETLNKTLKLFVELKEFICFKDGDRIAMFIAEGGLECIESRKPELEACANKTFGNRLPAEMNSIDSLPLFILTDKECNDFDEIRTCLNTELEKCKDSTPANIIDAFFKFLKKHMPCDTKVQASASKEEKPSDGNGTNSLSVSLLFLGISLLFAKVL